MLYVVEHPVGQHVTYSHFTGMRVILYRCPNSHWSGIREVRQVLTASGRLQELTPFLIFTIAQLFPKDQAQTLRCLHIPVTPEIPKDLFTDPIHLSKDMHSPASSIHQRTGPPTDTTFEPLPVNQPSPHSGQPELTQVKQPSQVTGRPAARPVLYTGCAPVPLRDWNKTKSPPEGAPDLASKQKLPLAFVTFSTAQRALGSVAEQMLGVVSDVLQGELSFLAQAGQLCRPPSPEVGNAGVRQAQLLPFESAVAFYSKHLTDRLSLQVEKGRVGDAALLIVLFVTVKDAHPRLKIVLFTGRVTEVVHQDHPSSKTHHRMAPLIRSAHAVLDPAPAGDVTCPEDLCLAYPLSNSSHGMPARVLIMGHYHSTNVAFLCIEYAHTTCRTGGLDHWREKWWSIGIGAYYCLTKLKLATQFLSMYCQGLQPQGQELYSVFLLSSPVESSGHSGWFSQVVHLHPWVWYPQGVSSSKLDWLNIWWEELLVVGALPSCTLGHSKGGRVVVLSRLLPRVLRKEYVVCRRLQKQVVESSRSPRGIAAVAEESSGGAIISGRLLLALKRAVELASVPGSANLRWLPPTLSKVVKETQTLGFRSCQDLRATVSSCENGEWHAQGDAEENLHPASLLDTAQVGPTAATPEVYNGDLAEADQSCHAEHDGADSSCDAEVCTSTHPQLQQTVDTLPADKQVSLLLQDGSTQPTRSSQPPAPCVKAINMSTTSNGEIRKGYQKGEIAATLISQSLKISVRSPRVLTTRPLAPKSLNLRKFPGRLHHHRQQHPEDAADRQHPEVSTTSHPDSVTPMVAGHADIPPGTRFKSQLEQGQRRTRFEAIRQGGDSVLGIDWPWQEIDFLDRLAPVIVAPESANSSQPALRARVSVLMCQVSKATGKSLLFTSNLSAMCVYAQGGQVQEAGACTGAACNEPQLQETDVSAPLIPTSLAVLSHFLYPDTSSRHLPGPSDVTARLPQSGVHGNVIASTRGDKKLSGAPIADKSAPPYGSQALLQSVEDSLLSSAAHPGFNLLHFSSPRYGLNHYLQKATSTPAPARTRLPSADCPGTALHVCRECSCPYQQVEMAAVPGGSSSGECGVLEVEELVVDEERCEYGAAPQWMRGESRRSPRKLADQPYCPARFPRAKIQELGVKSSFFKLEASALAAVGAEEATAVAQADCNDWDGQDWAPQPSTTPGMCTASQHRLLYL
ncbi:hypothetical protein PR048_024334 [Dryococelus australis]|uniref:Uncharacterized protein n=1 Tax=Dryococelus australis TaxID=614101 RepID=A0ABQ9GNA8_9NEOP|nr:hypothetical protein PR048_024334 [Dryococelus australis]